MNELEMRRVAKGLHALFSVGAPWRHYCSPEVFRVWQRVIYLLREEPWWPKTARIYKEEEEEGTVICVYCSTTCQEFEIHGESIR